MFENVLGTPLLLFGLATEMSFRVEFEVNLKVLPRANHQKNFKNEEKYKFNCPASEISWEVSKQQ